MADGTVNYKFVADSQGADRVIAQMEKRLDAYENKLKQVARTSKKGTEEATSATQVGIEAIAQMAQGAVGLNTILQQGADAWRQLRAEIEKVQQASNKTKGDVAAAAIQMGMAGNSAQLDKFTKSIPGVLPEQALAAFEGVQSGQPQAGFGEQSRIARAVAAMAPVLSAPDAAGNIDTSKLKDFGETASTLEQFFTDLPTNDLLDLTTALQGSVGGANIAKLRSGGFERAINKMMQDGMSAEQALATASVGIDEGFEGKGLLNPKALAGLDRNKISALTTEFRNSMTGDIAKRALEDVARVNPEQLARQTAVVNERANLGPIAEDVQVNQTAMANRRASQGFFQRLFESALFGPETLAVGSATGSALGFDTGGQGAVSASAAMTSDKMLQLMEENNAIQKQLLEQNKNNRPPIQRNAQSE